MTAPRQTISEAELAELKARNPVPQHLYFTGKPCKHGHLAPRYKSDKHCVECSKRDHKICNAAWRTSNREYDLERQRRYKREHRDEIKAKKKAGHLRDPSKNAAKNKKWRETHKEYDRERHRQYRKLNIDQRRAQQRAARAADPEKMRQRERALRALNGIRYLETKRAWAKANKNKVAAKARRRRARKAGADGFHTLEDLARIRIAQGDRCAYCAVELVGGRFVDHIIALANGGSDWPKNIQLLCKSCNSRKKDLDPLVFTRRLGRLV